MNDTRTPADRINTSADRVHGTTVSTDQRDRATALLVDMLAAAQRHGATLAAFDWVDDLPAACVAVTLAADRAKADYAECEAEHAEDLAERAQYEANIENGIEDQT
jgi:hypothetical protein